MRPHRSILALLASLLPALLPGCRFNVREPPPGTTYSIEPALFCTGERLLVHYSSAADIDFVRVLRSDGTELVRLQGASNYAQTEPMRCEWAPLRVEVHMEDGEVLDWEVGDDVRCIDQPVWVSYASTRELTEGPVVLEERGVVQEWDTASGAYVDVKIYNVYQDFTGFEWTVPSTDFGSRAHLVDLRNEGALTLRFVHQGFQGMRAWTLAPGEQAEVLPQPARPWMVTQALYDAPVRRLVGIQKGEYTKPENEHFERRNLYQELTYDLGMRVVCKDQP